MSIICRPSKSLNGAGNGGRFADKCLAGGAKFKDSSVTVICELNAVVKMRTTVEKSLAKSCQTMWCANTTKEASGESEAEPTLTARSTL
jgi:hypothetical protein